MSQNKPENPPAFACANDVAHQGGMTLRDYFAGQALAGILSCPSTMDAINNERSGTDTIFNLSALISYGFADAMLNERSK